MAALVCEICGGKLMAKAGGLFECEYCGMQYDKTRIQEMVQEIKGTVHVEGTVEVTGTVKLDGPVKVEGSVTVENLLKRGRDALSDGQWSRADEFYEKVLDLDSENVDAYLGKLMAAKRVRKQEQLQNLREPFDLNGNYIKALRYADNAFRSTLEGYNAAIKRRNEEARQAAENQRTQERISKEKQKEFRKHAEIEDGNLVEYRGTNTSITIPDDVTGIYDGAFLECPSLEEISISDSHPRFMVKSGCLIDKETASIKAAFGNPVIPTDGSVTQICTYAFSNCKMTSITIPNCIEEICGGAFAGCTALKDIKISNSHPSYRVRNGCIIDVEEEEIVAGFAHSTIPLDGGVTAIGWMAFENCEGLTTIDIPEGIITIGEDAFCGCKNLRFISLPNGVENIEHQAFFGCESLSFIEIPESVEFIDEDGSVFKGCNKLTIYAPKGSYAEQWATKHRIPVKENDRFKRERLEKERKSLENELSNLRGLFTGRRRKEIEARLLEIENELKGLK